METNDRLLFSILGDDYYLAEKSDVDKSWYEIANRKGGPVIAGLDKYHFENGHEYEAFVAGFKSGYTMKVMADAIADFAKRKKLEASLDLDLSKFVSCDETRDPLMGVFHEDGYQVATDTHCLVAIKREYNAELEGKITYACAKKFKPKRHDIGDIIGGRYPNWRSVISEYDADRGMELLQLKDLQHYQSALAAMKNHIKQIKPTLKEIKSTGRGYAMIKIGVNYFELSVFEKFVEFMKFRPTITQAYNVGEKRSFIARSGDDIFLMMPVYPPSENPAQDGIRLIVE